MISLHSSEQIQLMHLNRMLNAPESYLQSAALSHLADAVMLTRAIFYEHAIHISNAHKHAWPADNDDSPYHKQWQQGLPASVHQNVIKMCNIDFCW